MSYQERALDSASRRRSLMDREQRKELDAFQGKPRATRGRSAAGKGDQPRLQDKTLFDLGWLTAYGETPEIRDAAAAEWRRRRDQ